MTDCWKIPDNLSSIWAEEGNIIEWSEGVIQKSEKLIDFVEFIHTYMDYVDMLAQLAPQHEFASVTIGLLSRTFDDASSGLRAAFSGRYRDCAMYCRDLIEVNFLLEYLLDDKSRVERWLNGEEKALKSEFSPRSIRDYLDRRDGFKERKRKANYDALAQLGVHPVPRGFRLHKDGTNRIRRGPFQHLKYLQVCLEECLRHCFGLSSSALKLTEMMALDDKIDTGYLRIARQKIFEKYMKA